MKTIIPSEISVPKLHHYLLGAVGPRPIAFASTIDKNGNRNLAPFSFFNVFSANPPILIFSPARSGRTGETKHTHDNVKEVAEVVINIVNYSMVKSGFTPVESLTVKPWRVKESPVQIECEVIEVKELGELGGAGNLIICKVKCIHINESVLDANDEIDQTKIDQVARMGGNWYCRAHGEALFEVQKPLTTIGIGIDSLPEHIRFSKILTGNDLGRLGNLEHYPTEEKIVEVKSTFYAAVNKEELAIDLINEGEVEKALCILL